MKTLLAIIPAIYSLVLLSDCHLAGSYERGNGNIQVETRSIDPFSGVTIGGNFEVTLIQSDHLKLEISADENLLPLIESNIEGDELIISSEKNLISREKMKIRIYYNHINEINIMGAALINNEGIFESDDLILKMEGAGVVDLNIKVNYLETSLSGAGLVNYTGYADAAKMRLSGAGAMEAYDLETKECDITVSGVGGAQINVSNKLTARVEGVGGIEYIGNPQEVDAKVSGVGKIKAGNSDEDKVDA